ncbi:MAG: hypothetical protein OEL20_15860 [Sulfuritalea sp.]|nr:hypothetical protein [Sulfuritalea sp.]
MSEARIVWANDTATNAARHITEVSTGLACHCVCPGCGAKLEAVNAQNPNWKRRPHFRHYEAPELVDCAQQAVLTGAREALKQANEIELPALRVKRIMAAQDRMEFVAEVNEPAHRVQIEGVEFVDATDAVLTLSDGQQVYVRLVATAKRPGDPKQLKISEVLIDISDPVLRTANPEVLRQHITLGSRAKHWCHHLREPDLVAEAEAKVLQQVNKHSEDCAARFAAEEQTRHRSAEAQGNQRIQFQSAPLAPNEMLKTVPQISSQEKPSKSLHSVAVDYVWSQGVLKPSRRENVIRQNMTIWPQWDWRAIMAFGESARLQGISVDIAVKAALERFRFSENNNVVRDAWRYAGIIFVVPRTDDRSDH